MAKKDDDDHDDEPKPHKSKKAKKSVDSTKSIATTTEDTAAEAPTDNNNKRTLTSTTNTSSQGKTYEERCQAVNVISHPLASKKSTKKLYKLVKKASSQKHVRRGVKEVVKGLRKGDRGLAVLAGDIYPIDVVSHLPILLEDYNVPYLFVPSKQDLGAAASTKRPTSCVLIKNPAKLQLPSSKEFDGQDLYDALLQEAKEYNPTSL